MAAVYAKKTVLYTPCNTEINLIFNLICNTTDVENVKVIWQGFVLNCKQQQGLDCVQHLRLIPCL